MVEDPNQTLFGAGDVRLVVSGKQASPLPGREIAYHSRHQCRILVTATGVALNRRP